MRGGQEKVFFYQVVLTYPDITRQFSGNKYAFTFFM